MLAWKCRCCQMVVNPWSKHNMASSYASFTSSFLETIHQQHTGFAHALWEQQKLPILDKQRNMRVPLSSMGIWLLFEQMLGKMLPWHCGGALMHGKWTDFPPPWETLIGTLLQVQCYIWNRDLSFLVFFFLQLKITEFAESLFNVTYVAHVPQAPPKAVWDICTDASQWK